MEDNQGAIFIAKNPVTYARSKHIDVRYHEALRDGMTDLQYCPTQEMTADILVKPLHKGRFEALCERMGLEKVKAAPLDELSGSVERSN